MRIVVFFGLIVQPSAAGLFAFSADPLVSVRADPIVTAGRPAGHVHHVYGGSGFGLSQTFDDARAASCTTVELKEDKSNYWTNALYRKSPDGTYTLVHSHYAVIYYKRVGSGVEAFPKDFRMVGGGAGEEKSQHLTEPATFVCIDSPNWYPQSLKDLENGVKSGKRCGLLRIELGMPNCHDGRMDSDNHRDHVTTTRLHGGRCPSSHPHQIPQIFYEFMYNFQQYYDEVPGSSFVFSDGTDTQHGDFLNGWDVDKLQRLVSECNTNFCNADVDRIMTKNPSKGQCKIDGKSLVNEEVTDVKKLPVMSALDGPLLSKAGVNVVRTGIIVAIATLAFRNLGNNI